MNNKIIKNRFTILTITFILAVGGFHSAVSQDLRWFRIGQLQSFIVDYGAENEQTPLAINTFAWPAQYGDNQYTSRAKGLWIGAQNFSDPVEGKVKSVKVIGTGPRYDANNVPQMIFSKTIKCIGRENPPKIFVDNQNGTNNTLYDIVDELNPNLPCDRMIVVTFNTSLGVSVTKKVLAFTQQNHDNYYVYDIVFKNTGIYNEAGDIKQQTLTNFWVFFNYRYGFAGVTSSGARTSTWGDYSSEWGESTESYDFGPPYRARPDSMRGFYAFYSPLKGAYNTRNPVSYLGYDYDWGCPNQNGGGKNLDGLLGSAKYSGCITLLASQGPGNLFNVDDYNQPATVNYFDGDGITTQTPTSQYDENFMGLRWAQITEGHLPKSLVEAVGEGRFMADWLGTDMLRPRGGQNGQGYGGYTLAPGDSIHIVYAEGASGISWEKCREVGANWYAYYKGIGTPILVKPDGSVTTSYTDYTKTWVQSGIDSIIQTFKNARANYRSGYNIPRPPPPPTQFNITSRGDKILLEWTDNADNSPHFNGYVIYRCQGTIKDYRSVYEKIFQCDANASNVVHTNGKYSWADTTAVRGFNYYYYIQSKDDGTQNEVRQGVPLYSSLFLTMTMVPAHLLRASGDLLGEVRVVPNPYDIRSRKWQFGELGSYDRIMFYGLPPKCRLKIFSEDGALIWEKLHINGAGDEAWDSKTSSNQIVVSGMYILYVEVIEDTYATQDLFAKYDVVDENLKLQFAKDQLMFRAGEKIFSAGKSTFRKFVVIR